MTNELSAPDLDTQMDLEKLLHYRVQRLASKMELITSRKVLAGSGVHIGEWRLICLLREHGQTNHKTISRKLSLDPGRTSKLLKAAEMKDMIVRTSDPNDGRASLFSLTSVGKDLHEQLWPKAVEVADGFHGEFATPELRSLNSMLDKAIEYANSRIFGD